MTIDHDELALEVAKDFTSDISTHNSLIDFARRYRKALAEKMEPVGWFLFDDDGGWQQLAKEYEDDEDATKLYSLEDWKK